MTAIIRICDLAREYRLGSEPIPALRGVTLDIERNEWPSAGRWSMDRASCWANEPTGNLDSATSEEIMGVFADLHAGGQTVIVVTHEPEIAARAQRILVLRDGRIESDRLTRSAAA